MRTAFIIVTGLAVLIIAYGYPFVAVLRGKRLSRTVGIAWGVLLLFCFLCLLLTREGFVVMTVMFMGWMPPLMAGAIALAVRPLLARFWPAMLKRIEAVEKKGEAGE